MIEMINKTTLIRNIIVSSIAGIVIPFILVHFIDRDQVIFNFDLMISNGIIFIIIYSGFGLFKKETFIRLVLGGGYIILLFYFYQVGSNVFTFYLPHCAFGVMFIDGNILGMELAFTLNYSWMVLLFILIKSINLARHYIEPTDTNEDWAKDARKEEKARANINILS